MSSLVLAYDVAADPPALGDFQAMPPEPFGYEGRDLVTRYCALWGFKMGA